MKNLKNLGIAGGLIAAALVGGTLISAVTAAPSSPGTKTSSADVADKAKYCDTWQEAFADELNVSVDDLLPAAKAASIAAIDAAVTADDMTEARATELKAKVEAADGNACRLFGHPSMGNRHGPKAHFGGDLLTVAADALGMEPGALRQALRGGDSLRQIATDQVKDYDAVSKAVHDAAKANLDAAVADGLDQARADELLAKLDEALASGDFPNFKPGRGHFGLPGFRHHAADEPPDDAPAT